MELVVKHFSELTAEELFEIYKLRVSVFVVEQKCPYQEVDEADRAAYHLWLKDEDGIESYARVLPQGVTFPTVAIGRVIAVKRRCGLGSKIVEAAASHSPAANASFCRSRRQNSSEVKYQTQIWGCCSKIVLFCATVI